MYCSTRKEFGKQAGKPASPEAPEPKTGEKDIESRYKMDR